MFAILDGAIAGMEEEKKRAEELRLREEVRLKAEIDRRMREETNLRTLQTSTEYLQNVCNSTSAGLSVQGFSDAVTGLMSLGDLCGKDEVDLIRSAILARPELLYHAVLRQYFQKTQDAVVGHLFLERFLTIPNSVEVLGHDHPTVVAAKQALGIAAESYGTEKKNLVAKFAELILFRFPGMPGNEYQGFKALLHAVSRTGILKEESPKIPSPAKSSGNHVTKPAGSKIPDKKYASNKGAAAEKVQAMVLPGATASMEDLASNSAAARAKANKNKNKKKAA